MSDAPPRRRRILAFGSRLAALAGEALPGSDVETVPIEAADAAEIARSGYDLLVAEPGPGDPAKLAALLSALGQAPRPPGVVLVGAHLPAALARIVFRLGRADVLEAPAAPADLARSAAALFAAAGDTPSAGPTSQVWTVTGAVGGAGATMLAIEIAAALAARRRGDRTLLIDLNLADGQAAAVLGLTPAMRLAEASSTPERIDSAVLSAFVARARDGFDLLASPRDPDAFERVSRPAVQRLLEVASQTYDWVVIDLPRHRRGWTLDVLAGADERLVISELTVPALLAARDLALEIEAAIDGARTPRIVLNRMAARMFGPAPSRAEAERALGRAVDGAVTSDWEAAACAANLGGSVREHRAKSRIVRDVRDLVERLAQGLSDARRPGRAA